MKKKRLVISNYDSLRNIFYSGGGAISIHEIAIRLNSQFEILIVSGKYPGCQKNTEIDGINYCYIGSYIRHPQISQIAYQIFLPFKLKQINFDLWIESFTPPFSTTCLQLFTNKPVIGLVHMLSGADMARKYHSKLFKLVEDLGIKSYRSIIVTSNEIKEQLLVQNKKAQIFTIPNGTSLPKKTTAVPNTGNIVFLGRFEINQKGLDLLVRAFALIESQVKAKLIIAGMGTSEQYRSLLNLIKEYKIDNRTILKGKVSGKSKDDLYESASVIVIPSRFETFSLVALESMSHARPLITFDIPGLKWVPSSSRLCIDKFNVTALSAAMLKMINNKKNANLMGTAGKKFSKNYSWDKIAKMYHEVISLHLS